MSVDTVKSPSDRAGSGALLVGGLAAILASTCCLGPLVLVALGLSGAWIGNLTLLEPYRPFFIAGESHNECGLPLATREGHQVRNLGVRAMTWDEARRSICRTVVP